MHTVIVSMLTLFLYCGILHANEKGAAIHNASNTITGTLLYRERMLLPTGSSVTVTLEDLPYTDTPATVIATTTFKAPKASPISFSLTYDRGNIQNSRRYTLKATITHQGNTLFHSVNHVDPFHTPLNILLKRSAQKKQKASIADIHWKLLHIEGASVASSEKLKDPNFILKEGNKVIGFTGCNRFVGTYELHDDRIRFSEISATPMQCSETMETEKAFKSVLQHARHYKLKGETLEIFDDTRVIASFRAVYF